MLFLVGSHPQISYLMENGPHIPTILVHALPTTPTTPSVPKRSIVKYRDAHWPVFNQFGPFFSLKKLFLNNRFSLTGFWGEKNKLKKQFF